MAIENNTKRNVIWNLIFSIVSSLQTVLLLLLVNRIINEDSAGIFGFGFSVAVLLMYIGNFGVRNFQVSDTKEKYSSSEYYGFRTLTCILMILGLIIYCLFSNLDSVKLLALIFLTLERFAECIEDVFHGRYQQKGCLYLAGIQGTIRYIVSDILFLAVLIMSHNLVYGCFAYFISALVLTVFFAILTIKKFDGFKLNFNISSMKGLFISCFPLFCGYFLSTYLTNVPKYTIENNIVNYPSLYSNVYQAYFNMIFMPVLMINLLSTVIFRPFIVDMANYYNNNDKKNYFKIVNNQMIYIVIIGAVVLPLCYLLGLPVLSLFYSSDLSGYKLEFMLLMVGGVFSAFSSFFNVCIITIRQQRALLISTIILAIVAFISFKVMPYEYGMLGISAIYLGVMILQAIIYYIIHFVMAFRNTENK